MGKRRFAEKINFRFLRLFKSPYFICVMSVIIVVFAGFLWYPSVFTTNSMPENTGAYLVISQDLVCVNTATIEELCVLPGIGESKAQSIIEYRKNIGFFTCAEDLTKVFGIGEKTARNLKEYISFE